MQSYENEKYGKIQYPFNWEYDGFNYLDNTHESLGKFSPISNLLGPSVSMSIYFLPSDNTLILDQYAEQKLQEIKNFNAKDFHFNKLLSFDKTSTLGGKPAYKIVYQNWFYSSYNDEGSYLQYIQVGTITEGLEYRLQFSVDNAYMYNQYAPLADKIINSFEFIQ
jgi:hypothetical protein